MFFRMIGCAHARVLFFLGSVIVVRVIVRIHLSEMDSFIFIEWISQGFCIHYLLIHSHVILMKPTI